MDALVNDLRYALRALRRTPAFSAIAVGCLAAAIGVNAVAFSMLDALLFRDLPGIQRQNELTAVLVSHDDEEWGRLGPAHLSPPEWEVFRHGIPAFSRSAVAGPASVALRVAGAPLAVRADFVSGAFFAMLATRPAAGRLLSELDDQVGAPPAVVIGYHFWRDEFGLKQDAIGQSLYVGNAAFTIVGVAPMGFVGLYPGELVADPEHGAPYLYLPLATAPLVRAASRYASPQAALDDDWLPFVGRRRPGATAATVEAQANAVAAAIAAAYPRDRANASAVARHPSTASTAEEVAAAAFVMAVPVLILLVACANLANQLLARAVQRGREIAVRLSLGATRARLVRLLLIESTALALAASLLGLGVARLLTDALRAFVLVVPFRIPIDLRVLVFTTAIALVTALVFGLVPALRATRLDLAQSMKEGAHAEGYTRSRLRSALVVTQVAASVALLALAGVFGRASHRSRLTDDESGPRLLTFTADLDLLGYEAPAGLALQTLAMERLRGLPGVEAVALAPFAPAGSIPYRPVSLAGDPPDQSRWYEVAAVAGDWFAVRPARPVAGRLFTAAEMRGGSAVAVVDQVAASRLWPGASAVGQTLRVGEGATASVLTVIGVVPPVNDDPRDTPAGVITLPAGERYEPRARLYVRAHGNAADLRGPVRNVMRGLDDRLPVASMATLEESRREAAASVAQIAQGVGAMGTVALLLAALGLSAVLAFIVEQRRYEIGVRIALGARSVAVTWMILRQALVLSGIGIAGGALVAGVTATLLRSILFGVPPIDPVAFGGSTAILLVVAILSSVAPARRAANLDPMIALRTN
jgi:predicted permease